jgi:bifunctional hydroxylase/dehydrase
LLAGDAAHVHLPAGGQGLSVSVQDSMNLGWKLAGTICGWAPATLLDTYNTERHPVGARLLINTQAQGYLFQSGVEVEPLRAVFAELMEYPEVGRHLAGMVSGLDIRYDVGPGTHPLLGLRMPNERLLTAEGTLAATELLHSGQGVLLDLMGQPEIRRVAAAWSDRVRIAGAQPERPSDSQLAGTSALLIRPDGYIAWAGSAFPDQATLRTALHRWFGPPARTT